MEERQHCGNAWGIVGEEENCRRTWRRRIIRDNKGLGERGIIVGNHHRTVGETEDCGKLQGIIGER